MNQYAARARSYFQEFRPQQAATMTEDDWTQLGDRINSEIIQLTDQLAGSDPTDESHLDKVARLNSAQTQATEIVMDRLVYSQPAEPEVAQAIEAEDRDPEMDAIWQATSDLQQALMEDSEDNDPQ